MQFWSYSAVEGLDYRLSWGLLGYYRGFLQGFSGGFPKCKKCLQVLCSTVDDINPALPRIRNIPKFP